MFRDCIIDRYIAKEFVIDIKEEKLFLIENETQLYSYDEIKSCLELIWYFLKQLTTDISHHTDILQTVKIPCDL